MEPTAKTGQIPQFIIFRILWPLEVFALAAAITGITLKYLQLPGADEILLIGMSVLSVVYFLMAYKPPVETTGGEEQPGFGQLFVGTIVPKVIWTGCSIVVIGSLFGILHLPGAGEMLTIGTSALAICILMSIYFIATGSNQTGSLMNTLYRAAPLCIFGIYVFMNLPPK